MEPVRHGAETGLVGAETVHQQHGRLRKGADAQLQTGGAEDAVVHPTSQELGRRGGATPCLRREIGGRNAKTWLEHGASPRWSERSARRNRGGSIPLDNVAFSFTGRDRDV